MFRALILLGLAVAGLYLAGVTPTEIKQRVDRASQEASVQAHPDYYQ